MWKIHVIWQSLKASGPQDHFFKNKKNRVWGVSVPNYRSLLFFVLPQGAGPTTNKPTNIYTIENRNMFYW